MTFERVVELRTLEQTESVAGRLARAARALLAGPGAPPGLFIGLSGDLGAGKTAFVQGFVAALDPETDHGVTSPTFAIVQTYETSPPVTHMDLYRLSTLDDLEAIGYRDHYFGSGVTLVEWVARVPEAIPEEWIEIHLAVKPSDVREMRVRSHGERLGVWVERALE